jgi:PAS domain S-box-containing protein
MNQYVTPGERAAGLRRQAEEQVRADEEQDPAILSPEAARRLFHELRVHQIELEMQNEELRRAQVELDASRARYFDLYDLAPVGYFTLNERGILQEANLTSAALLGVVRSDMAGQPLSRFIVPDDQDTYYLHFKRLVETAALQTCEIRMVRQGGIPFWARLEATAAIDVESGARVCRCVMSDIHVQKEAEDARRQSEGRLKKAQQVGHLGHWDWHSGRQTLLWSDEVYRISGVGHDFDLTYKNIEAMIHPGDREANNRRVQELLAAVDEVAFEFRIVRPDGQVRYVAQTAQVERDADGQMLRAFGIVQDITERKQAEEALRVSLEKYRVLFDAFPLGITISDEQGNVVEANQTSTRLLGLSTQEHARRAIDSAEWQIIRLDGTPMPAGEYASVRALRDNRPIENVEMGIDKGAGDVTWLSVTAAPIPLEGYGVAIVYGDISERVRFREALRASEERYRLLIEGIQDSVYVLDREWRHVVVNDAAARFAAIPRERLLGSTWPDLFPGIEHTDFFSVFRQVMETRIPDVVTDEYAFPDGRAGWYEVRVYPIPEGVLCISRDITKRVQAEQARQRAEEALRESEARYRLITERVNDIAWQMDASLHFVYVSPAVERVLGYTPQEVCRLQVIDLLDQDGIAQMQKLPQGRLGGTTGSLKPTEYRMKHKAGHWVDVEVVSSLLCDAEGHPRGFVGITRNITERKQTEAALAAERRLLRTVIDSIPEGVYVKDTAGRFLIANEQSVRYLGTRPGKIIGQTDAVFLPPELARRYSAEEQAIIATGRPLMNVEERIIDPAGNAHWFSTSKVPFWNSQGQVAGIVGIGYDITARKQAEEVLREREAASRHLAQRLQMVHEMGIAITLDLGFETLMERLYQQCHNFAPVDVFYVALYDDASGMLTFPYYRRSGERMTLPSRKMADVPGLCGYVIEQRQTFHTPDNLAHPLAIAPVNLPGKPSRSIIAVPLLLADQAIGVLSMQSFTPGVYTPEQVATVELLGTQVAIVIRNSQLYEQTQSEIAERVRVAASLRQSREQLRALTSHLQSAQEQERAHLAREVHDELGQALTALKIDLAWLGKRLPKDETALANKIEDMTVLVEDTTHTVRRMATELRPGLLDDLGLVVALEWQISEFARRTGLDCRADLDQEGLENVVSDLDRDLATAIFRIAQEALTNVARHAQATEVEVSLRREHDVLLLTVHDDGIGLVPDAAGSTTSLGLLGMRERALAWQGRVTFESLPGQGTTVTLRAPMHSKKTH